jgi:hypothetical protein
VLRRGGEVGGEGVDVFAELDVAEEEGVILGGEGLKRALEFSDH